MCQQASLHKSMIDNPLGFIIFYVFAIVFVALLFQLSKKDFSSKRKKKIAFFWEKFFTLILIHLLLIFLTTKLIKIFSIKSRTLNLLCSNNFRNQLVFTFYYISFFTICSFVLIYFLSYEGIQISNFIFSFFLFFETLIKIADSNRFIEWIGESLEKTVRYLIMFVICLNCTYFFTRITYQILRSTEL